jgi:hypothetical protein
MKVPNGVNFKDLSPSFIVFISYFLSYIYWNHHLLNVSKSKGESTLGKFTFTVLVILGDVYYRLDGRKSFWKS